MNIFDELIVRAEDGCSIKVDFENQNLKFDKEDVISNGILVGQYKDYELFSKYFVITDPWKQIEILYKRYKKSIPSKKDICNKYNKEYFKALSIKDLEDIDLVIGVERNIAKATLEGYFLLAVLDGRLKWKWNENWFWQSEEDSDLIVLRKWIEKVC